MTNHEYFFGTPERAAKQMDQDDAVVACFKWQKTLPIERREGKTFQQLAVEWLQEEYKER